MSLPFYEPWFAFAVLIVFVSAFIQGLSGFGMALLAVPLLLSQPGIGIHAVPCLTIVAFGTVVEVLYRYRRHLDLERTLWLAIPALVSTPLGVELLQRVPLPYLRAGVGIFLMLQSLYQLRPRAASAPTAEALVAAEAPSRRDYSRRACVVVGLISGVLGGSMGMVGPLLAAYLIASGISRDSFKVTLNAVFMASLLFRTGNFALKGMLDATWALAGLSLLPVAWLGGKSGVYMDRFIPAARFAVLVNVFLLGLGGWMFVKAWQEF